jgi:hypothetical protein
VERNPEDQPDKLMKNIAIFALLLLIATSAVAVTKTVKAGGGGDFTTIQACATAMASGDTCTVYAGTYAENVTVTAGGVASYKTFNVNGSDVVNVYSFTLNSHTKVIGNCSQPAAIGSCGFNMVASSPLNTPCVTVPDASTDIYITNNVMSSCGSGGHATIVWMQGTNGVSYVYIQGNTMSYGCGTAGAPNNCSAVAFDGNHVLIENNDMSHLGLAVQTFAQFVAIRNNKFHDMHESEAGASSGNGHLDIIYAERSNTVAAFLVQYQLWEGNTGNTVTGVDGKGLWTAADNPGGCGTSCFNVIGRFNVLAHFGSGSASHTSGFLNVKYYNNSIIDPGTSAHGSASADMYLDDTSTGGAIINNLIYYPFAVPSAWHWSPYALNSTADQTGFTQGANLAFCSSSPCSFAASAGSTNQFPNESPVISPNILASTDPLVNYAGGDFRLVAGSQALNAGTYLTTVAAGDSGAGTSLVVTDAGFFQDGLGLNAVGVQADCVSVTTVGNHVCITAVNYSTNTLTMASGFSRSNGDHIWLYSDSKGTVQLTGTAPNIGASPSPNTITAPTGLAASMFADLLSPRWRFDDFVHPADYDAARLTPISIH